MSREKRRPRWVLTLLPTADGQSPVQTPAGSWAAAVLMASAALNLGAPLVLWVRANDGEASPTGEKASSDLRSARSAHPG